MLERTCFTLCMVFILAACRATEIPPDSGADGDGDGDIDEHVEVLLTNPPDDTAAADRLIEIVDGSERSLDISAFVLDHEDFLDAVMRALDRGVRVRVVSDDEVAEADYRPSFDILRDRGAVVTLQTNDRYNCHNKFLVADDRWVFMGSTNFTFSGFHRNNNASVLVESHEVAADFSREFEQLFNGVFGSNKPRTDEETSFNVGGVELETRFAPQERPDLTLIGLANTAQDHIFFMVYVFTLDEMADALIAAVARGVQVSGIVDQNYAIDENGAEMMQRLRDGGVVITLDINPWAMHHKLMIVDPQGDAPVAAVGSGNWTYSLGHGNDESYLIIRDQDIVETFFEEFQAWLP